jgi:hypothetical protein
MISGNVEFLPPIFYTCFGSYFENGRHLENFENAELLNLFTADLRNYWTEFHETLWSYRYMFLVGPKVFSFVIKGVKVIF